MLDRDKKEEKWRAIRGDLNVKGTEICLNTSHYNNSLTNI